MTGQQLKNSILQLAVQGKLVPQDPTDEPASVLLARIREEKEQLIREKKIKREKNPSEIFRGDDVHFYERVGKNEPVCIDEELPFEIPETWEWARLGSIVNKLTDGTHSTPHYIPSGIPFISVKDVSSGQLDLSNCKYISKKEHDELYERCNPEYGDILLTKVGTTGVPAIVNTHQEFSMFVSVALLKFNQQLLYNKYLRYSILSPLVQEQASQNTRGVGNKNWVVRDIARTFIPIPPLTEQQRIVAKIEELLPYVERYEQSQNKLEKLNTTFPDQLKKSILQEAIQGKLMPQDPADEPASALLARIRAEKEQLIKEGKIKREKNPSQIFRGEDGHFYERIGKNEPVCIDDQLPFEIPEMWEWARLGAIALLENGDRSSKYPVESDYVSDGIPFFGAKDMGSISMNFDSVRFISEEKFNQLGNGKLHDGDLICLLRGNVGKTRLFRKNEKYSTGFICAQMLIIRCINLNLLPYLYSIFSSQYYFNEIEANVSGTAVRQLPAQKIAHILIPLPPLAEQQRIVAKLEQLLPLCEHLK